MPCPFTHFYSDPHFWHANIIRYAKRPFADEVEMNRGLVERYQAKVPKDGHTLWLGDCFWYMPAFAPQARELLSELPGRKTLILGNHDVSAAKMLALGFETVHRRLTWEMNGLQILACHYPPQDAAYHGRRPALVSGVTYMHGHAHEKLRSQVLPTGCLRLHMGVDAWDYAPASVQDVLDEAARALGGPRSPA